jgi:thioredoxin-dependent peroxiredoxin
MASVTLGGHPADTIGNIPAVGSIAPDFILTTTKLRDVSLSDYIGFRKVLNIFPSIDTSTCAASTRKFNEMASQFQNTKILCISKDLPFAHNRFCAAEGIAGLELLSDFKTGDFGKNYGLEIIKGVFEGLHSRAILVLDTDNKVIYAEQVIELDDEPDYEATLKSLQ